MKKKDFTAKKTMKNKKEEELLQKRLQDGIVQYYVLDEDQRIALTGTEFCQGMHELIQFTKKPFPNGEVMLLIKGCKKSWISSNIYSLIAFKENKKEALFYINMDKDFNNNNESN